MTDILSNGGMRKEVHEEIKSVEKSQREEFSESLKNLLTPSELKIQEYVDELAFSEGAWYRPFHNIIVPASMIAITEREGLPRDLVYVAQLHDAGYSFMNLKTSISNEAVDKRKKHQELGAALTSGVLGILSVKGDIDLSLDRVDELVSYVAEHDEPYIRGTLSSRESECCRSADRTFPPSTLSWFKNFLAYYDDAEFLDRANGLGIEINPTTALLADLSTFYDDKLKLPEGWDQDRLPLKKDYVKFMVAGRCEPCYTETEQAIVDFMFNNRARDVDLLSRANNPKEVGGIFGRSLESETQAILDYAGGGNL